MSLKSDCKLTPKDWEFVKTLARVGHVSVLTSQVNLLIKRCNNDTGSSKDNPLVFPNNWSLQYVGVLPSKYEDEHFVSMTFEVLAQKT